MEVNGFRAAEKKTERGKLRESEGGGLAHTGAGEFKEGGKCPATKKGLGGADVTAA